MPMSTAGSKGQLAQPGSRSLCPCPARERSAGTVSLAQGPASAGSCRGCPAGPCPCAGGAVPRDDVPCAQRMMCPGDDVPCAQGSTVGQAQRLQGEAEVWWWCCQGSWVTPQPSLVSGGFSGWLLLPPGAFVEMQKWMVVIYCNITGN